MVTLQTSLETNYHGMMEKATYRGTSYRSAQKIGLQKDQAGAKIFEKTQYFTFFPLHFPVVSVV